MTGLKPRVCVCVCVAVRGVYCSCVSLSLCCDRTQASCVCVAVRGVYCSCVSLCCDRTQASSVWRLRRVRAPADPRSDPSRLSGTTTHNPSISPTHRTYQKTNQKSLERTRPQNKHDKTSRLFACFKDLNPKALMF